MDEAAAQQELRESMDLHLRQKAQEIIDKFGNLSYPVLEMVMQDRKHVRYPVNIIFDSSKIEAGLFATTEMELSDKDHVATEDDEYIKLTDRSYNLYIHECFEGQPEKLLPLIIYQLPIVNYGDIASYEDSEVFGSALMQMDQDDYYQVICDLADSISG